jgi:hypothetical protein
LSGAEDASGNAIPVANLQIFDTTTRTWETNPLLTPPLPKALMQCAVTSIGTNLYAFGGLKSTGTNTYAAVTDAYAFDTVANAWSSLAVLPTAVAYAAAAPSSSRQYLGHGRLSLPLFRESDEKRPGTIPSQTSGPHFT